MRVVVDSAAVKVRVSSLLNTYVTILTYTLCENESNVSPKLRVMVKML